MEYNYWVTIETGWLRSPVKVEFMDDFNPCLLLIDMNKSDGVDLQSLEMT